MQTEDFADASELFDAEYAYFSGFSKGWLEHAKRYVADMTDRFGLNADSHVVEVAANDGYLLQYVQAANIPALGIEPTASTAAVAREKGIEIVEQFFGVELAEQLCVQGKSADLMTANNVLAHVPDINDFVGGFAALLKPTGVATFEFPHLMRQLQETQFDTIYHEHFSYLSLIAVRTIFEANGLTIFDVESLTTHGGSLRVYAQQTEGGLQTASDRVGQMIDQEHEFGINAPACYQSFQQRVERVKDEFVEFLIGAKRKGKTVAGYGAAAKGNTFMNYAGIRPDLIKFVVDRNPVKQNKWMPGSRIPIVSEEHLKESKPDYIVILPWNLATEVGEQLAYAREWGAQFVIAVPELKTFTSLQN